ncbi:hypothetical protein A9Q77_04590 [Marinomonas sp. 42_23_T18]|nr:hypothetical protein A9Q77_04590 [Marinomonas sp. 42_23_T18]
MDNLLIIVTFILFVSILIIGSQLARIIGERRRAQVLADNLLQKRCDRIAGVLHLVSDRYMPIQTKMILIEFLISGLTHLQKISKKESHEATLYEIKDISSLLKTGKYVLNNEKVTSKAHMEKVNEGLLVLPAFLKGLTTQGQLDKSIARNQVELIRYMRQLAATDLYSYVAQQDLDADRLTQAREKYLNALAGLEKFVSLEQSKVEIERLQYKISQLDQKLHIKMSVQNQDKTITRPN